MQDFDSLSFHGIDHDVRERRKRQFFGAAPVTGPASVRCGFQNAVVLVDSPHSRFREVRVVLLQIVPDAQ